MKAEDNLMQSIQYEEVGTCEKISLRSKESSLIIYAIGWAELE